MCVLAQGKTERQNLMASYDLQDTRLYCSLILPSGTCFNPNQSPLSLLGLYLILRVASTLLPQC